MKITDVKVIKTPDSAKDILTIYDHSGLSAVNTCPKWGLIRYGKSLVMPGTGRAMALEAGEAAHWGFAAVRLYQLMMYSDHPSREIIGMRHGERIFGKHFDEIYQASHTGMTERERVINMACKAMYCSGFYDEPTDLRRTVANIADCLVAYVDRWDMQRYPVWYENDTADARVGVEIPFDMLISMTADNERLSVRYCGKIDGLHWDRDNKKVHVVHENKTGSRLDDAWLAQWRLSHQITGYSIGSTVELDVQVDKAHVIGMKIPTGRDVASAIRPETVNRNPKMLEDFFRWVAHTLKEQIIPHQDDVINAPMYTHSCNRYFRECPLLPLCTASEEEQKQILGEMEVKKWSPLDTKVQG